MKAGYLKTNLNATIEMLNGSIKQLKEKQCEKVVIEIIKENKKENTELKKLLESLNRGDQLVMIKMSHFASSFKELFINMALFKEKGIHLQFLTERIDTTLEQQKDIFLIFDAITTFRKDVARKRTLAGLNAARARGRKGGRPKGISEEAKKKATIAKHLYQENKLSINDITQHLAISRSTLYKYLRLEGVKINGVSAI